MKRGYPLVAAFDLLVCLLLVFVILAITSTQKPPSVPTYGAYAITITWAANSNDDVDLYVRDPLGHICFFVNPSVGLMNLEHDDLGTATSGTQILPDGKIARVPYNGERVVIRGVTPGEYTVNVRMYDKQESGPTVVTARLWSLQGADRPLLEQKVTLRASGDQITAFRFTLDAAGHVIRVTHVQANLAGY